jgi:hypothetical protein
MVRGASWILFLDLGGCQPCRRKRIQCQGLGFASILPGRSDETNSTSCSDYLGYHRFNLLPICLPNSSSFSIFSSVASSAVWSSYRRYFDLPFLLFDSSVFPAFSVLVLPTFPRLFLQLCSPKFLGMFLHNES